MSSTFAVQPIPPYNPSRQSTDHSHRRNSQALPPFSSLAHIPSSSSAIANSSSQPPRRYSSTGASSAPYPSVFEIPNPQQNSNSNSSSRIEHGETGIRRMPRVQEEENSSDSTVNGKKRRAIDEVDGDNRGTVDARRRESQESTERRGSNESNGIRASFSFPANPHPSSHSSRPQSHSSRPSISSIPSPPPRNSPSPRSTRENRLVGNPPSERYQSPNSSSSSSSKRARTCLGPLESRAATASDILSSSSNSPSPVSATSTSASTPPTTAGTTTIASLIGPPSDSQSREHETAFENSRQLKEQQQHEIERRRIAAGGSSSTQPIVGSVQAALGKLKTQHNAAEAQRSLSRTSDRDSVVVVEGEDRENGGLAKRRGHRPPAVTTNSYPPSSSNSTIAVTSAKSYEEAMKGAPSGIPSVLVGSPVEASWAVRMGKEAGVGSSRRQSTSTTTGPGGYPSFPTTTNRTDQAHQHHHPLAQSQTSRSITPSSSARGYSHQPPSSHLMSTSTSRDRHPPPSQHQAPPIPSPSTPLSQLHSHPLAQSHSYDRTNNNEGSGTRLPPLSLIHLRNGGGGNGNPPLPSHTSSHSASYYPPQSQSQSHSHPHSVAPPPSATPQSASSSSCSSSASKTAFLSLFSTFFDSLQDSKFLTTTLENQINRSSSLLNTLQQSELVLERLVDRKIDQVELKWERRTQDYERKILKRLERLENIVYVERGTSTSGGGGGGVGLGITEQPPPQSTCSSSTLDRLERLEEMFRSYQRIDNLIDREQQEREEGEGEARGGGIRNNSLPTPDRGYSES